MSAILFLDDDRARHRRFLRENVGHAIEQAFTAAEAMAALDARVFDVASLDHDLDWQASAGLEPLAPTGMAVAEHIAAMPADRRPRRVIVHSINRRRAIRMWRLLRRAGVEAELSPFE